ncbi:hypothetical protein [Paenibacillus eucommiae]|uniref:DUF3139 domain-containing protein n=1 Tax=Paenibacillus eucommiae TaxID=1355755 RepID=A0ABS4ISE7_9BACL|nr:hypothetical protein [Paenibacillus eucommiae]MBP1990488.1 hypothetical protein [Paenibacillus eucommiae]
MKFKIKIGIFLLVMLSCTLFYYFFITSSTVAIVTLEKKVTMNDQNFIKVHKDNKEVTIRTPDIVWPFLEEGKDYFISYHYNLIRKPFLVKINESKN